MSERRPPALTVKQERTRSIMIFSAAAVRRFNLSAGMYIHFFQQDNHWSFIVNTDSAGFKLSMQSMDKRILKISSKTLVALFKQTTMYTELPRKFALVPTTALFNDQPLIEVKVDKPLPMNASAKL